MHLKDKIVQEGLTFDDVLLVPGFSKITPDKVKVSTTLVAGIELNIPLLSAAMDTVTDGRMAIAVAQEGGIGIVHRNLDVEDQVDEVRRTKKFESGVVHDPITIDQKGTVEELMLLRDRTGFSSIPVVSNAKVMGIVTRRDTRFENNMKRKVTAVMTPKERLVTVKEDTSIDEVQSLLKKHRLEQVLVVDDESHLMGLITAKDMHKQKQFPAACVDGYGRLRVGASIGVTPSSYERATALVEVGVDVLVVDSAHGHSNNVLDSVKWIKKNLPSVPVIAGNIATGEGAKALQKAGVDAVKVGIGAGSICTTRVVTGVGVPQLTAIANAVDAVGDNLPVIADGGLRFSGDVAKALAVGASSVMVGNLFAGADEAPGEVELFQGRSYKTYRGMGSMAAMAKRRSTDRYFVQNTKFEKISPEGVEGRVPSKGPVRQIINQLIGGLRASMGYLGCETLTQFHQNASFMRIFPAGMVESHVHNVSITREAPNYPMN